MVGFFFPTSVGKCKKIFYPTILAKLIPLHLAHFAWTSQKRWVCLSTMHKWKPSANSHHNKTIVCIDLSSGADPAIERTSINPTWHNHRQPVTFYCGNLQWALASSVWRLTGCRWLQNRCFTEWNASSRTQFYPEIVSRNGSFCTNLDTHSDLFCENLVLPWPRW